MSIRLKGRAKEEWVKNAAACFEDVSRALGIDQLPEETRFERIAAICGLKASTIYLAKRGNSPIGPDKLELLQNRCKANGNEVARLRERWGNPSLLSASPKRRRAKKVSSGRGRRPLNSRVLAQETPDYHPQRHRTAARTPTSIADSPLSHFIPPAYNQPGSQIEQVTARHDPDGKTISLTIQIRTR